jgi:hypothetical protein
MKHWILHDCRLKGDGVRHATRGIACTTSPSSGRRTIRTVDDLAYPYSKIFAGQALVHTQGQLHDQLTTILEESYRLTAVA